MLYQLVAPGVVCDSASRGLQPRLRHFYSEWWSNSPLISPHRLSNFVLKIKQSLIQNFLVNFTVRPSCSVLIDTCAVCIRHVTKFRTSMFLRVVITSVLIYSSFSFAEQQVFLTY